MILFHPNLYERLCDRIETDCVINIIFQKQSAPSISILMPGKQTWRFEAKKWNTIAKSKMFTNHCFQICITFWTIIEQQNFDMRFDLKLVGITINNEKNYRDRLQLRIILYTSTSRAKRSGELVTREKKINFWKASTFFETEVKWHFIISETVWL